MKKIQLLQLVDDYDNTKMTVMACSKDDFGKKELAETINNELNAAINATGWGNLGLIREKAETLSQGKQTTLYGYSLFFEETTLYD